MNRYFKIPLLFFFLASGMGVLLRLQFITPIGGVNYQNVLHGHSHMMFLGWVFNTIYLSFVIEHIPNEKQNPFKVIFWLLQLLNVGMAISFPIQGYGTWSIVLSGTHTVMSAVFVVLFFRRQHYPNRQSLMLANASLVICLVSALGPFALAYISANGLAHTDWYNYAIYFYLHFQYNGFFLFAIASMFVRHLEQNGVKVASLRIVWILLIVAVAPTYLLSILYSSPGFTFNLIGGCAAALQVIAVLIFLRRTKKTGDDIRSIFRTNGIFIKMIAAAILLKSLLQLLSATPEVSKTAYEFRPIIIAYLHLVLVGIVSLFLLIWLNAKNYFNARFNIILLFFSAAYVVMEFVLIQIPWWPTQRSYLAPPVFLFATACILSLCCLLFLVNFRNPDKSHTAR